MVGKLDVDFESLFRRVLEIAAIFDESQLDLPNLDHRTLCRILSKLVQSSERSLLIPVIVLERWILLRGSHMEIHDNLGKLISLNLHNDHPPNLFDNCGRIRWPTRRLTNLYNVPSSLFHNYKTIPKFVIFIEDSKEAIGQLRILCI